MTVFFLGILSTTFGYAQNTILREISLTKIPKPDQVDVFVNHQEYSALVVRSSIPNLIIDSNLGVVADLTESGSGIYRVILRPGNQIITFKAQGYISVIERITDLRAARDVVYYTVEPEILAPVSGKGSLTLNSIPSGATIRIEGFPAFSATTPFTFENYAAQTYSLILEKPNYQAKTIPIQITADEVNTEIIELIPDFGLVSFDIRNTQGQVINNSEVEFLNRIPISEESDPIYTALRPGRITAIVKSPGFREQNVTITLNASDTIDEQVILLSQNEVAALPGTLQITSDPLSRIYVNGVFVGNETAIIERSPGSVFVRVEHPLGDSEKTIFVGPEQTVTEYISILPSKSATRAKAIIPGLAHISTKRARGWLYLVGVAGAGTYSFLQHQTYSSEQTKLDDALVLYHSAATESSAISAREQVLQIQDSRDSAFELFTMTAYAAIGLYAISLIDGFTSKPAYGFKKENPSFSMTPTLSFQSGTEKLNPGINLSIHF